MFKMRVFPVDFLIGGFKHFLFFHSVGNVIIPTDEGILIYINQRGRRKTTNQIF